MNIVRLLTKKVKELLYRHREFFKESFPKCAKCPYIPCINLFMKGQEVFCVEPLRQPSELDGMEIYVLRESIAQKAIFPCLLGAPIHTICKCNLVLYDKLMAKEEDIKFVPLVTVLWQCIKDFKCSAF